MDESFLNDKLKRRKEEGTFRVLPRGLPKVDFLSNDYLGLARNKNLRAQIDQRWDTLKEERLGGTGSRLLSGSHPLYFELEEKLKEVFQCEAALMFNSGYDANMALLSAVPQRGDVVLYDELSHACLKDGARLSLAESFSFRHNDLVDLEKKLGRFSGRRVFVVTESLFSMDGDFAPFSQIVQLVSDFEALLIVDEAHTTGVYGERGGGFLIQKGIESGVFARVHTFGKGVGGHGACVVGSDTLISYLVNYARPFIYTTSLPPHNILSLVESFKFLISNMGLQQQLQEVIASFRDTYQNIFQQPAISTSAIQPIFVKGNQQLQKITNALQRENFAVMGVRAPTVKAGEERIRICLHSYNTLEEIESSLAELKRQLTS